MVRVRARLVKQGYSTLREDQSMITKANDRPLEIKSYLIAGKKCAICSLE